MFPEISLKVTTGTTEIPARFTAPDASVVSESWVATPWLRSTVELSDVRDKLVASAVTVLMPIRPMNFSPGKVAIPSEAFLSKVPVRSADEPARETEGVPVVTRF